MMVGLLLYVYARGICCSRVIERACVEDVAFRVVAARQRPDHATIARFIERHEAALGGLFGEVRLLCARSGLANVGVIAIDGSKLQANASRDANVDYEQLAREIIEAAKATDAAEDELYGDARGDELPEELATGQGRRQQMGRAIARGSQVLLPPDTSKRKTPRPGWTGGYYAFMRRVLAGERGGELYHRRQPMIEPLFAQTKHNRGMARSTGTAEPPSAPNGG